MLQVEIALNSFQIIDNQIGICTRFRINYACSNRFECDKHFERRDRHDEKGILIVMIYIVVFSKNISKCTYIVQCLQTNGILNSVSTLFKAISQ